MTYEDKGDRLITLGVRLRAKDMARLDEARGGASRSNWVRAVLLAALGTDKDMVLTPSEARQLDDALGDCPHPRARRAKGGLCMACGRNVGTA